MTFPFNRAETVGYVVVTAISLAIFLRVWGGGERKDFARLKETQELKVRDLEKRGANNDGREARLLRLRINAFEAWDGAGLAALQLPAGAAARAEANDTIVVEGPRAHATASLRALRYVHPLAVVKSFTLHDERFVLAVDATPVLDPAAALPFIQEKQKAFFPWHEDEAAEINRLIDRQTELREIYGDIARLDLDKQRLLDALAHVHQRGSWVLFKIGPALERVAASPAVARFSVVSSREVTLVLAEGHALDEVRLAIAPRFDLRAEAPDGWRWDYSGPEVIARLQGSPRALAAVLFHRPEPERAAAAAAAVADPTAADPDLVQALTRGFDDAALIVGRRLGSAELALSAVNNVDGDALAAALSELQKEEQKKQP